jgi:general secretion pathway protein K
MRHRLQAGLALRGERGAVLLLALLSVFLVAIVASALLRDLGDTLASLSGRRDLLQARELAVAAVDWARNVLSEDARTSRIDYAGELWATAVAPMRIVGEGDGTSDADGGGEVSGQISDLSGRFNLNSLKNAGLADLGQVAAYSRLLGLLGIPSGRAEELTVALLAWQGVGPAPPLAATASATHKQAQALTTRVSGQIAATLAHDPPYTASGTLLADFDELALIHGYDAPLLDLLRPHAAALPDPLAPLNVNTASAQALAAQLPGLELAQARTLVARQLVAPFRDLADFRAQLTVAVSAHPDTAAAMTRLATDSRYFLVSGWARYGEATVHLETLLDRAQRWSRIVWRK